MDGKEFSIAHLIVCSQFMKHKKLSRQQDRIMVIFITSF